MDSQVVCGYSAEIGEVAFMRPILAREIPDPYCGGEQGFENVFDMEETASNGLMNEIRERYLKETRRVRMATKRCDT
jgi:protein-tyrosine-phosphatase